MAKKEISGTIIKAVGGIFRVRTESKVYRCQARGLLKRGDEKLYVGDKVLLGEEKGVLYIREVLPRKNHLIRPYVCNIDCLAVVIAPLPVCDWVLVDKLLLTGEVHGIPVVLLCNKSDMGGEVYEYACRVYGDLAEVYSISAETGEGIDTLKEKLKGVVCFAGQSAVGKSSIMNALADLGQETGELSKIQRGRNTTRHIELFQLNDQLSVMDTCGFSLLESEDVEPEDLALYYRDFVRLGRCKYNMCRHLAEPECTIKAAATSGKLDQGRYERYKTIYQVLLERRNKNYD